MKFWRAQRLLAASLLVLFSILTSCSGLFYQPSRAYYYDPKQFGFSGKEISFPSKDGTKLYAWYFPARNLPPKESPKGLVVQFHGNAENMTSHYLSLIWLIDQGYGLMAFDYRGYGKSEGSPSQKGAYEDGLAALQKAWELKKSSGAKKFIVYGQSLGGAIAARSLFDFEQRDQTDLLVMDSTFVSYTKVAQEKLADSWITWVFTPLGWLLVSNEYSAENAIRDGKTRLLVIHDPQDPAVPYRGARDFYEEAAARKEFWETKNTGHIGAYSAKKSPYRQQFLDLLNSL